MVSSKSISYPERLHVELTSRCNFKCRTCRHGYENYGEDLDEDVCEILVNDIIPNLKEIELQGTGESLLSHNFYKIFNAAKASHCKLILITNASLLNDSLIRDMVSSNMQLVISLDGADGKTFEKHRPIGNFKTILNNLYQLKKYRDEASNSDFSLVINMVVTKINYMTVNSMIDLASDLGVDYLFASEVRECMPDKDTWNLFRLDNIDTRYEIENIMEECKSYAESKGIGFNFNPYLENRKQKKRLCISPWKHMYLYSNGDLSVCCELNTEFGNIKRLSFGEVWNGQKLNDFRNDMLMNEYDNHCLNCCLPWGLTNE